MPTPSPRATPQAIPQLLQDPLVRRLGAAMGAATGVVPFPLASEEFTTVATRLRAAGWEAWMTEALEGHLRHYPHPQTEAQVRNNLLSVAGAVGLALLDAGDAAQRAGHPVPPAVLSTLRTVLADLNTALEADPLTPGAPPRGPRRAL